MLFCCVFETTASKQFHTLNHGVGALDEDSFQQARERGSLNLTQIHSHHLQKFPY